MEDHVTQNTKRINNNFTFHPPKDETQVKKYETIREHFRTLAHLLDGYIPESREKSLAMTNLEQAMFWSNAAVARNE